MLMFKPLRPEQFDWYAQDIFSILWQNMNPIAPSGNSMEEDFALWAEYNKQAVSRRKTILFIDEESDRIAGYFQYRLEGDTLWLDEIESLPDYQGKGLIYRPLLKQLLPQLPEQILFHQSYVHKENSRSAAILEKMGAKAVGENASGSSHLYKGTISDLKHWVEQK